MQVGDDLNPIRVLSLFSAISDEACELLDLPGRPENLIMTNLAVPPVTIRPSVEMDTGGGTNEDDITMKLMVSPKDPFYYSSWHCCIVAAGCHLNTAKV